MKERKKMIIGVVIAVITLLIVTIGATYAYFSVTGSNDEETTKLNMDAEDVGTVSLTGGANMHIRLSVEDMSQANINSKYYATETTADYVTEAELIDVASLLVAGGSDTATYQCTFDLNTSVTGTMADVITSGDAQIVYSGLIYATDDLSNYNPTRKIAANLTGDEDTRVIQAYVVFNNTSENQRNLAGKTLNINVSVTNFSCDTGNAEVEGATPIFYIGKNETQEYANTNEVSMTLSLENEDAVEYCITEESTSDNCEWKSIDNTTASSTNNILKLSNNLLAASNTITFTHTLSSGDGEKTAYAYLKSSTGSIKLYARDSIIIDSVAPTVTASINDEDSTMTIESTETGTYCVNTNGTSASNCIFTGSIKSNEELTTNAFTESGTYYVHVTDAAGNIGHSTSVAISIGGPIGEYLLANPTVGLDITTAYNGMYRYIGTSANNYVSLSGVLYRIIGLTSTANSTLGLEAGQLKLIKATSIGTYNWHTDYKTDTIWTSSAMYTYLQGNDVLNNTSIIPSGWSSKISSVKWNIGDISSARDKYVGNASTVLSYEDDTVTRSTSKIGLMYMSDYYYAQVAGGTKNCYGDCSNWMTLGSYEWTMTRWGPTDNKAWYVRAVGDLNYASYVTTKYEVRPVFYLDALVKYISGSGQESDPMILVP